MGIISWSDKKVKKMNSCDMAFVKIGSMLFGLLLGAYFSVFVSEYFAYFAAAWVLFAGIALFKYFSK